MRDDRDLQNDTILGTSDEVPPFVEQPLDSQTATPIFSPPEHDQSVEKGLNNDQNTSNLDNRSEQIVFEDFSDMYTPNLTVDKPTVLYASRRNQLRAFWEKRKWGLMIVAFVVGAFIKAYFPVIRVEAQYRTSRTIIAIKQALNSLIPGLQPPAQAASTNVLGDQSTPPTDGFPIFNPLLDDGGKQIIPADTNFGIVIPKLGINSKVVPYVDPSDPKIYNAALKQGVAHAATSYFPDQDGSVYLFSHSTNYEWYVKDLNALFYLLKNLENKDTVVLIYRNVRYTYQVSDKKIVPPDEIEYLFGRGGKKELILQTCWPPGTVINRMLIFADLVDVKSL